MSVTPSAPLRCALVGTGGSRTCTPARSRPTPAPSSSPSPTTALGGRRVRRGYDVPAVYDDLDALLAAEKPDVVSICTPPARTAARPSPRSPPAPTSSSRSRRRPPSTNSTRCARPRVAADRQLAVVFQQRTGTAAAHVRRLLQAGALGRPLIATCQTLWFRGRRLLRRPVARQVGDRGRRHDAGPRHPSTRPARVPSRRLGNASRPALAPRSRDRDGGCLDRDGHVRERRRRPGRHERGLSARDELDPHRHAEGDDHRRSPLRPRPRELVASRRRPASRTRAAGWALPSVEERSDHGPLLRDVFDALLAASRCRRPPTRRPGRSRSSRRSMPPPRRAAPSSRPPISPRIPLIASSFASPVTDLRPGVTRGSARCRHPNARRRTILADPPTMRRSRHPGP